MSWIVGSLIPVLYTISSTQYRMFLQILAYPYHYTSHYPSQGHATLTQDLGPRGQSIAARNCGHISTALPGCSIGNGSGRPQRGNSGCVGVSKQDCLMTTLCTLTPCPVRKELWLSHRQIGDRPFHGIGISVVDWLDTTGIGVRQHRQRCHREKCQRDSWMILCHCWTPICWQLAVGHTLSSTSEGWKGTRSWQASTKPDFWIWVDARPRKPGWSHDSDKRWSVDWSHHSTGGWCSCQPPR